jgi:maltoporin
VVLITSLFACSCFGPGNVKRIDLTPNERAVKVFYQGQKPDCAYNQPGTVEATSGSAFEMGTFASNVATLQREAAKQGANAVMVIDHSKNQMADQATGMAIRCK